jgi:hypothetical protein
MDFSSSYEVIKNALPLLLAVPFLRFLFGSAIYVRFIVHKVLGVAYDSDRPEFKRVMNDQLELDILRAMYPRFKFYSYSHAMDVVAWCQLFNLGMDDVQRISSRLRYDPETLEKISVYLPGANADKWASLCVSILSGFCLALSIWLVGVSGMFGKALVITKESEALLWMDNDGEFQRKNSFWRVGGWMMNKKSCLDENVKFTEITAKEKASLCEWISDNDASVEMSKIYKKSMIAAFVIFIIFGPWFWFSLRDLKSANTLERVKSRLRQHANHLIS